jgi:hypothetical protein
LTDSKYLKSLHRGATSIEDVAITTNFSSFFHKEFKYDPWFFADKNGFCYQPDYTHNEALPDVKYIQDMLSSALWVIEDQKSALIAGGGTVFQIHEDLVHSLSLDSLRNIFHTTLEEVNRRTKALGWDPARDPSHFYTRLIGISKEKYRNELLTTRAQYTASVVKTFRNTLKEIAVVVPLIDLESIKYWMEKPTPNFLDMFTQQAPRDSFEEVIEKLVILSHIDSRDIRNYAEVNCSPFEVMFKGAFKTKPKELAEAFKHYNAKYSELLIDGYKQEIHRIPDMIDRGRKVIPAYKQVYEIAARDGKFLVDSQGQEQELRYIGSLLYLQIIKNIQSKLNAGISQLNEILALQQISNDQVTSYNTELLSQMLTEANSQLGLIKLPSQFKKFEKLLRYNTTLSELKRLIPNVSMPSLSPSSNEEEDRTSFILDPKNPYRPITESEKNNPNLLSNEADIPFDIKGKSVEELKKMGFKQVFRTTMNHTQSGRIRRESLKESGYKLSELMKGNYDVLDPMLNRSQEERDEWAEIEKDLRDS